MTVRRVVLGTGALLLIGLLATVAERGVAERAVAGWLGAADPLVPLIVGLMNAAAVLALGAAALLGLATTFGPRPETEREQRPRVARRCRYVASEG